MAYSPEQWERAKAYYEAGQHTPQQISDIVGIERSTIVKKAKNHNWKNGINSDYIEAKTKIAVKKSQLNSQTLQILDDIADEAIKNKLLVYGVTQKALQKAHDMIDEIDNPNDLKAIVDLSDRASLTLKVNERHAPKQDINLTNAQQNNDKQIIIKYE